MTWPVMDVLASALSDAISFREIPDDCEECAESITGLCEPHGEDADCIRAYQDVAVWLELECPE